jgi:hypothetical protein
MERHLYYADKPSEMLQARRNVAADFGIDTEVLDGLIKYVKQREIDGDLTSCQSNVETAMCQHFDQEIKKRLPESLRLGYVYVPGGERLYGVIPAEAAEELNFYQL